jgi:hypothetical protein
MTGNREQADRPNRLVGNRHLMPKLDAEQDVAWTQHIDRIVIDSLECVDVRCDPGPDLHGPLFSPKVSISPKHVDNVCVERLDIGVNLNARPFVIIGAAEFAPQLASWPST